MLHAYAARFDVTRNLKNFLIFGVNYRQNRSSFTCELSLTDTNCFSEVGYRQSVHTGL